MNINDAMDKLSAGFPVTRKAWPDDCYLVIASNPVNGVPTLLIIHGELCSPFWEPSDEDQQAEDWETTQEEPVPLTGPREVL